MEIEFSLSFPPSRLLLTVCQGSRRPAGLGGQASAPVRLFLKASACAGVECVPDALAPAGISHQRWPRRYCQAQRWARIRSQPTVCPRVAGQRWGLPPGLGVGLGGWPKLDMQHGQALDHRTPSRRESVTGDLNNACLSYVLSLAVIFSGKLSLAP